MKRASLLVLLLGFVISSRTAQAHPLAPVALWVDEAESEAENQADEEAENEVIVRLKRARVMPSGAAFAARLPDRCRSLDTRVDEDVSYVIEEQRLRCEGSLVGARFGVDGLTSAGVDAVVRVRLSDGRVMRALLDESSDSFVVPERMSTAELATSFGRSGLEHLVGGLDHVLLVLGLVLLLGSPRRVVFALTAFTLGHGLSMCAAVLGWIVLPTEHAEAGIALTLVLLAWEALRRRNETARPIRRPYLAALLVGLVHGLGFAAVFSDAGLTGSDLLLGLGAFHVGIELGQVAVVLLGLIAFRLAAKHRAILEPTIAYGIGIIAYMWFLERLLLI